MSKRVLHLFTLIAALAIMVPLLVACGGETPTNTAVPATTAPAAPTATAAPAAPTATTAAAAPTTAPTGGGKIAILLPETKTARYETQDLPNFKAKLQALGYDVSNLIY